jgi:hypothetical protein
MTGSALGGTMIRSRLKKIVIIAGAGAVVTAGTLALNPFSASADGGTGTATATTVIGPTSVSTGRAVTFTASITPPKTTSAPVVKATGTVTFTVTGGNASSVACSGTSNAIALNGKAKAFCKIPSGSLLASASPYSVTAAYSGDSNFAASNDTISQAVSSATTHITLAFTPKPTSGQASVVTATLSGGSGALPGGDVSFTVYSENPTKPALINCGGGKASGNFQALSSNGATKPQAVATCNLSAGWFNVPAPSNKVPHPSSTWKVTASYDGDGNYGQAQAFKQGKSKG